MDEDKYLKELDDTDPDVRVENGEIVIEFNSVTLHLEHDPERFNMNSGMGPHRTILTAGAEIASMRAGQAEEGYSEDEGSPYIEHQGVTYYIDIEGFNSIWDQLEEQASGDATSVLDDLVNNPNVNVEFG